MISADATAAMQKNHSFWQYKYGDYMPNAALPAGTYDVDVLVVGAGFTGLTAAREVKKDNPDKNVMVLEAREIGFGASGRNGGFNMTLFGLEPEVTVLRWGRKKAADAQVYIKRAVAYVKDLIETHNLDSDYEHTGMWRVAYSPQQEKRLKKTYDLLTAITEPGAYAYYGRDEIRAKVNIPEARAAIVETETGILDPCKHVRELKRLAQDVGADIYENTAVTDIQKVGGKTVVTTADATVVCKKLVLATNAWTHTVPGPRKVRNRQTPVWTYQIVTEPLTEDEWAKLNWSDRFSIEDNRQLVHYLRITKCGRITVGGNDIEIEYRRDEMDLWHSARCWQRLEDHFRWMFPSLKHKKVDYKWGGAVSVNLDQTPEIAFIGNRDIIHASGCIGHGVSLTQLNGRLIADLIAGKDTDLTRFWIVNRTAVPMPPGNLLAYAGIKTITGVLHAVDRYEEQSLKPSKEAAAAVPAGNRLPPPTGA